MKTRFQFKPTPFELTVILVLALIGWVAYKLNELGPGVSERGKGLADLRDEYIALADSVQTNLATLETIRTNAPKTKDTHKEADHFDVVGQDWSRWLEGERRLWAASGQSAETNSIANGSGETSEAQVAHDDLLPLLATIRKADSNYVQAGYFLILNTGQPLITDKLQSNEQLLMRNRSWLMTLSRRARLSATAVDVAISGARGEYSAMKDYFRYIRVALLIAIFGLCFLLLNAIYRRAFSKTRALLLEHEQQQAEQRATLEKLAHFGRLAQELAHEIKQPLTAMNARAYTLQKALSPDSDAFKDAVVIRGEIKRLDTTVKEFLQLARPAEPRLSDLPAGEALSEIRNLMAPHLAQCSIDFKVESEDHLSFRGDAAQIKQVLINLIKNAAESLGSKAGSITLRAKKALKDLGGKNTEVAVLEVADNGPGIPVDLQDRIFEPFFSTKGDGTGLGLAICTRIVDKHGGRLEFDTEPGKGTVFRIILPACRNGEMK